MHGTVFRFNVLGDKKNYVLDYLIDRPSNTNTMSFK